MKLWSSNGYWHGVGRDDNVSRVKHFVDCYPKVVDRFHDSCVQLF